MTIAGIFSLLAVANAALITWYNHRESTRAATVTAQQLMDEAGAKVVERVTALFEPATALAGLASSLPDIAQKPDLMVHPTAWYLMRALAAYPQLYSAYMGYDDGDFHQIIAAVATAPGMAEELAAPEGTAFALRTILRRDDGSRFQIWSFLDADRRMVGARVDDAVVYDPRLRGWYVRATDARTRQIASDVYVFQSLRAPGLTMAQRFDGEVPGVFGVDVTLDALSRSLAAEPISSNGRILLYDDKRRVIAFQDPMRTTVWDEASGSALPAQIAQLEDPALDALAGRLLPDGIDSMSLLLAVDGIDYVAQLVRLPENVVPGGRLAVLAPLSDFTGTIEATRRNSMIFASIALVLSLLFVAFFAKKIALAIQRVEQETARIRRFDLAQETDLSSHIDEIHRLGDAVQTMKRALRSFARFVPTDIVRQIVESGAALEIGGQRQTVTVMFTDIAGFTTLS